MKRGLLLPAILALAACSGDPAPAATSCGPLGGCEHLDEQLSLRGLSGPVDVVRDRSGRIHIYASTITDAMVAQGYLVARDRAVQMQILRRLASGELAEVFGALGNDVVESDIAFRHIGLRRVAEEQYQLLAPELRAWVEGYASGVSQLHEEIRSGARPLGEEITILEPAHFVEWTPVDSLAIGRLQTWLLSYTGDEEIAATELLADLRAAFHAADPDPAVQKRAGIARDLIRFEPPDHATTVGGPSGPAPGPPPPEGTVPRERAFSARRLLASTRGFRRALARARALVAPDGDFGSNNWAVAPAKSASGRALLASDPHLSLSSPAVFWPLSIHVEERESEPEDAGLQVGGIAFPGIPGIILGHNEQVAWGATVAGYDVADVYAESLTPDGEAVLFRGRAVPLETIEEVIALPGGEKLVYPLRVVPHHGPIVPIIEDGEVLDPDPAAGALSVRWTGMEPTAELTAIAGLLRARDVHEARAALASFDTGAQNWMLADVSGDIAWTSHALVPYRDERALGWDPIAHDGLLPCLVLPGDGTAEWTGFWNYDAVPWALNPPMGYLATANQDPIGGTLDNDPSNDRQPDGSSAYLGCMFAHGFRQGRIRQRIEAIERLSLEDMSAIQGDVRSPLGSRLVPALLLAIESAQAESSLPGTHPGLAGIVSDPGYDAELMERAHSILRGWKDSGFEAASGVDPDDNQALPLDVPEAAASQATLLFNTWLVRVLARVFGDEHARVGRPAGTRFDVSALLHLLESDPAGLATYDAAAGDSALWDDLDTPTIESRQERMMRALLDAFEWLEQQAGPMEDWRWGRFHTVRLEPALPLFPKLVVPRANDPVFGDGFPRPGDSFVVDSSNFSLRKKLSDDPEFRYRSGPTQRFVIELEPGALIVRNALPGGAVGRPGDPHYADQLELWRRNETAPVPFERDDVLAALETRALLLPAP